MLLMGYKTEWEKEKMLLPTNDSFSHIVSTVQSPKTLNLGLCSEGLSFNFSLKSML